MCFGTLGSVRTSSMPRCEWCAPDDQTFCPFTIQSSPSRYADVRSDARSDPAPGSLKSWHQISSPAQERPEPACLLLVGPVGDQGRAGEHDPDPELVVGHVEARPFLVIHDLLGEGDATARRTRAGHATAAQPSSAACACQTLRAVDALGLVELGIEDRGDVGSRSWRPRRRVRRQPRSTLGAELRFFGRVDEVHAGPYAKRRFTPAPSREAPCRPRPTTVSWRRSAGST